MLLYELNSGTLWIRLEYIARVHCPEYFRFLMVHATYREKQRLVALSPFRVPFAA